MAGGAIIVISSHVARGSVGNRAIVFALERLGFEVWAVPTILLPHHPGHGPVGRIVPEDAAFGRLLEELVAGGRATDVAGIISGYFASPAQVTAAAGLVATVKAARPDVLFLCDPVIGDSPLGEPGQLYIGEAVAHAVRDELMPLADAATPNAFECAWLSGAAAPVSDLARLARGLAPTVLVTSAPAATPGYHGNILVQANATTLIEHPTLATPVKGTGDLLAAVLLARRLAGRNWLEAAGLAVATVFEIVAGSAEAGADELMLAELQHAIAQPRATADVRRLQLVAQPGRGR